MHVTVHVNQAPPALALAVKQFELSWRATLVLILALVIGGGVTAATVLWVATGDDGPLRALATSVTDIAGRLLSKKLP